MTNTMDPTRLDRLLRPPVGPWRQVELHATLGSTNGRAAALGQPYAVVVAEQQTAGRGRLTRSWQAPAGTALTVSATLPAPPGAPGWMPLVAGLAVVDAVREHTGLDAVLKWPNDVLLPADGDRKVCGILCEWLPGSEPPAGKLLPAGAPGGVVVVGIGLNVSQGRAELPVDTATSLALAGAPDPDRTDLLVTLLARLHDWHATLLGEPTAAGARAAYRSRCVTIGARVRLERPDRAVEGVATGVDDQGALLLDAGDGRGPVPHAAGDVGHLRVAD